MTSKNSFWVDLKENNKRRVWLWLVSWLVFLLYYVAGSALTIISENNYLGGAELSRQLSDQDKRQVLMDVVAGFLASNSFLCLAASVLAVLGAIQGFAYLYSRKQVDLYHSLPVKKSRRFVVIWLNGILIYLIPSLTAILGGILVAATQGLMNAAMFNKICMIYASTLILYISLYNLTVIAVMLTGHIVITLFAVLVLQAYEYGFRLLLRMYMTTFFNKYPNYGLGRDMQQMWLSPYWTYFQYDNLSWAGIAAPAGSLLLMAIMFLAVAYLLYQKRPSEAAGRAMTFAVTKPVVKVALTVPAALAAAILIQDMISGYGYTILGRASDAPGSPWFIAFTLVAASAIGCAFIEVVYEFDIKACLRRKKHILLSIGLAVLLYLGFRYDMLQYDAYLPEPDEVESFAVTLGTDEWYFDKDYRTQSEYEYVADHMFLTDVEAVLRLAEIQPDNVPGVSMEAVYETVDQNYTVRYRLKNGREVERLIWIDHDNPETGEILNRIVSSAEFRKGAFMVEADYFDEWLAGNDQVDMFVQYSLGAYTHAIPEEEVARLIEAYRRDLEFINFTDMTNELTVGRLVIDNRQDYNAGSYRNSYSSYSFNITIYADCVQTIACLKDMGFMGDEVLNPEDVARIVVTNYNYNYPADADDDAVYRDSGGDYYYDSVYVGNHLTVTASFDSPEEVAAISQALYPMSYSWWHDKLFDKSYEVQVFFKPGTNPYQDGYSSYSYCLLAGQVPGFVEEATKYTE